MITSYLLGPDGLSTKKLHIALCFQVSWSSVTHILWFAWINTWTINKNKYSFWFNITCTLYQCGMITGIRKWKDFCRSGSHFHKPFTKWTCISILIYYVIWYFRIDILCHMALSYIKICRIFSKILRQLVFLLLIRQIQRIIRVY